MGSISAYRGLPASAFFHMGGLHKNASPRPCPSAAREIFYGKSRVVVSSVEKYSEMLFACLYYTAVVYVIVTIITSLLRGQRACSKSVASL